MGSWKTEACLVAVTALVSCIAAGMIVLLVERIQPGIMGSRWQTFVFAFIGVFAANLLIETIHARMRR